MGSPGHNECSDFSNLYYIEVVREPTSSPSCEEYEIEVSNGVW